MRNLWGIAAGVAVSRQTGGPRECGEGKRDAQHKHAECWGGNDRGEYTEELRRSTGGCDHAVFHVGISDLPERHSDSPPEVNFRFELRADNADSVRILWVVFYFFDGLGEANRLDWVSAVHGCGATDDGCWCVFVRPGGKRAVLSTLPRGPDRAGGGNHLPAGRGESVCDRAGQAGNSVEPAEPDARIQLPRH